MKKMSLDGKWSLSFTLPDQSKQIRTEVEVPSNVEPYLVELGLLKDYMPVDDPFATQAFEAVDDWTYITRFDAPAKEENETQMLVFEGIDTIAEVYLNGEHLLDCRNMHMSYRADVTAKLRDCGNELKVVIRSSELYAREHLHDVFSSGRDGMTNYDSASHLRKARHQWGWDNAPRLLTSGIIRSVYLETLPPKRFEEVYLYTDKIGEDHVLLGAAWTYRTNRSSMVNTYLRLSFLEGDKVITTQVERALFVQGLCRYAVPRSAISLWWPMGFGEPKLYTVRLEMLEGEEVVATYESAFGIRTVRLDWTEDFGDDEDGKFEFTINGEPIYIRGTNWKPLDPLVSLADAKLAEGRGLEEIKDLNCNMVRIWGGGIYEPTSFFEYCDRNGILVWQDFMFACEIPSRDDDYCALVRSEAEYIVKKYRNHPSLAVWCGDNENDKVMQHLHQNSCALPSDSRISRVILREAVLGNDPYRNYIPSSPLVSDRVFKEITNGQAIHRQTERHLYPEIYLEPAAIRSCGNLFLGETGPFWTNAITVNARIFERERERAERLWNESYTIPLARNTTIFHQDAYYFKRWRQSGRDACERLLGRDFSFSEFADFATALNFLCAEDFKDLIEYCRISRPEKTGLIWWSLMDMFPMLFNYSVIDCDGERKMPYYWIRQSQQPFALIAERRELGGELALYAANDTLQDQTAEYTVTAYGEDLSSRVIASGICRQAKNSVSLIQRIAESEEPMLWIIRWSTQDGRVCTNHVITKNTTYDVARAWIGIIGRECGFLDEILELKAPDANN